MPRTRAGARYIPPATHFQDGEIDHRNLFHWASPDQQEGAEQ
jgi:hypothetical protein